MIIFIASIYLKINQLITNYPNNNRSILNQILNSKF